MAKRLSPALLAASILLFIYAGVGFWVGTSDREARWGLRAGDGRILLEPAYASVEALDAGLFLV